MAIYLSLKNDCSSPVTNDNPISTKHTSNGDSKIIPVYIANDGKRKNVPSDQKSSKWLYTNIQIRVEGVSYTLKQDISPSDAEVTLHFDSVDGWNIGTIIQSGTERMKIEEILTDTSIRVQRNYKTDGNSSLIGHKIGAPFVAENKSVALALPDPRDYKNHGDFLNGGAPLTSGLDPTILTLDLSNSEKADTVKSNDATKYREGSLIKIDKEIMKVTKVTAPNDLTVIRGYNDTERVSHNQNSIIYCVGIVDVDVAHKIFIKNTPPPGLPTQKKADVRIVVMADEEPA